MATCTPTTRWKHLPAPLLHRDRGAEDDDAWRAHGDDDASRGGRREDADDAVEHNDSMVRRRCKLDPGLKAPQPVFKNLICEKGYNSVLST